jgi:hypothetical protein
MGEDVSYHKVLVRNATPEVAKQSVLGTILQVFREMGYIRITEEEEAERSIVVGPPDRWIHVGDSTGSTEWADSLAFDQLSRALSRYGIVVDVMVGDTVTVHFALYRDGELIDRFKNYASVWGNFASQEEAESYRGVPELWEACFPSPEAVSALRSIWVQGGDCTKILGQTTDLFGWEEKLVWVGYTFDIEGIPNKWNEEVRYSGMDLTQFTELHFRKE